MKEAFARGREEVRIASSSGSGAVLNDRARTDRVKGESFREQKSGLETPPVSFSGSEKSAKRVIAGASLGDPQAQRGLPDGFKKYASARAAPPEV